MRSTLNLVVALATLCVASAGVPNGDTDTALYTVLLTTAKDNAQVKVCGGARLDDTWSITAAECFDSDQDKIFMNYGDFKTSSYSLDRKNVTVHPLYNPKTKAHNIAILECRHCRPSSGNKQIILPAVNEIYKSFETESAKITAWDVKSEGSTIHVIDTVVMNKLKCKAVNFFAWVKDYHICASGWRKGGLTKGDAGAPMVVKFKDTYKLVGVATSVNSWGGTFSLPIVFTRVSNYLDWIYTVTKIPVRDGFDD